MTAAIDSRPLSFSERSRLLAGAVKVLFVLLPFVLYLVFLTRFFGPPVPLFYLLMAAVAVVVGLDSLRCLRDLQAGVVEIRDDVLERSRASRGPGRHFFGQFRELGKVSMTGKAHFGGRPGAVHRVTYSPRSRFVWAAEVKSPYS